MKKLCIALAIITIGAIIATRNFMPTTFMEDKFSWSDKNSQVCIACIKDREGYKVKVTDAKNHRPVVIICSSQSECIKVGRNVSHSIHYSALNASSFYAMTKNEIKYTLVETKDGSMYVGKWESQGEGK